jgi:CBS domain-containing protein/anti-sigma regulatory factor (Ser/Thr protein kinase)
MISDFNITLEILFELKASDVMKRDVVSITPEETMFDLHDKLKDNKISGLPVLDGEKLVGIISIEDLIKWLLERKNADDCQIKEKMIKDPICIYEDQPLVHVIREFDKYSFGRFPVLDRNSGMFTGIITKGNIIEGALRKFESDKKEEEIKRYRASHFFQDIIADKEKIYLTYNIEGKDFDNAGKASTTMKKNLKRLGIRPDIIHRVAIASYEGEMNLVIYAHDGKMEYIINEDKIVLVFEDKGPGIKDIDKAMQPGYTTSASWVKELGFGAGMGLSNIKKCSDIMDIKSTVGKGTRIKITIFTGEENETSRNSK